MSSGVRPASATALRMQPMMALPSGLDRVRWNVGGRERRQEREADQAFRIDRAIGADAERGVGLAAADRLDAELNRARSRRTGGRNRNRRALGAEALGEMLRHRSEQATFVNGTKTA